MDAGGSCKQHFDLPESFVGDGVHAMTCKPSIDTMETQAVLGDKWAVITQHADQWAKVLNGEVQKA